MIKMYTDAAVKIDTKKVGIGVLALVGNKQFQLTYPLNEEWDNHQAEFIAVIYGLKWLIQNNYTNEMVFCFTDSQIVAQSIKKQYAKNNIFQRFINDILKLMDNFSYITIEWIPESQNKGADNLARQALYKAASR